VTSCYVADYIENAANNAKHIALTNFLSSFECAVEGFPNAMWLLLEHRTLG
jgi:hypothetical protein